jgi:hypothetical protein
MCCTMHVARLLSLLPYAAGICGALPRNFTGRSDSSSSHYQFHAVLKSARPGLCCACQGCTLNECRKISAASRHILAWRRSTTPSQALLRLQQAPAAASVVMRTAASTAAARQPPAQPYGSRTAEGSEPFVEVKHSSLVEGARASPLARQDLASERV